MVAGKRILIVEDEPDAAHLLEHHLRRHGYRTSVAPDGLTAVNETLNDPPDLLILDLMLPKLDGWEVFRLLKGNARTAQVPVIMLTALATMEQKLEGLRQGADDYLTKPYDARELLARINVLLLRADRPRSR